MSYSDNILEWAKISIAMIVGYIIFKALLSLDNGEDVKCICDCVNQTIKSLPRVYGR